MPEIAHFSGDSPENTGAHIQGRILPASVFATSVNQQVVGEDKKYNPAQDFTGDVSEHHAWTPEPLKPASKFQRILEVAGLAAAAGVLSMTVFSLKDATDEYAKNRGGEISKEEIYAVAVTEDGFTPLTIDKSTNSISKNTETVVMDLGFTDEKQKCVIHNVVVEVLIPLSVKLDPFIPTPLTREDANANALSYTVPKLNSNLRGDTNIAPDTEGVYSFANSVDLAERGIVKEIAYCKP